MTPIICPHCGQPIPPDEAPSDRPPPLRRLPYIAKKTSVLQGSDHIAVARSKTTAKRIANALNKHTPNDEGV